MCSLVSLAPGGMIARLAADQGTSGLCGSRPPLWSALAHAASLVVLFDVEDNEGILARSCDPDTVAGESAEIQHKANGRPGVRMNQRASMRSVRHQ